MGTAAVPAGAAPVFREEKVYLTCPDPTPVQNVNRMAEAIQHDVTGTEGGGNAGWSTSEPDGTYTELDPCVMQDVSVGEIEPDGGQMHLVMRGTFTGNLDTIAFDLYQTAGITPRTGYGVSLWVDGRQLESGFDEVYPTYSINDEDPYIYPGEIATRRLRFALDDLGIVDDPDGDSDVQHDILIRIDGPYDLLGPAGTWLWGARSFPGGLTFNGDVTGLPTPQDRN